MKIEPNYLYRVLPRLESNGQVKRDGQGWHPPRPRRPRVPRPCAHPPQHTRRQAQVGGVGDSARADSASRRVEGGDQRPQDSRRHQVVGARGARRW